MITSWHSYPSIFNMGHRALRDLLEGEVIVEEKVDGSQFSFGKFDTPEGTVLRIRSKGCEMNIDAPEKMFAKAAATVKELEPLLTLGWTYRGEYLAKPKHNALSYDRVPKGHIILFDINTGEEAYLSPEEKRAEAERLGLECVPALFEGKITDIQEFRRFLDTVSVLGGQKIEGVVVKPKGYALYGPDKKALLGKFVSEAFKEVHQREWAKENPKSGDVLDRLVLAYRTPARWQKALQHLKEAGKIEDSPRDIGLLIREVPQDVLKECEEELKAELWKWAWPHLSRGLNRGLPEWYKDQLLKKAFENDSNL